MGNEFNMSNVSFVADFNGDTGKENELYAVDGYPTVMFIPSSLSAAKNHIPLSQLDRQHLRQAYANLRMSL